MLPSAQNRACQLVDHRLLSGMKSHVLLFIIVIVLRGSVRCSSGSLLATNAATRAHRELWCYRCAAAAADDRCARLRRNATAMLARCRDDRPVCMVKRISYTTATENSTSILKMWSLERDCARHCEPGCIVVGERTKLYACTSCCASSSCNVGSRATRLPAVPHPALALAAVIAAAMTS